MYINYIGAWNESRYDLNFDFEIICEQKNLKQQQQLIRIKQNKIKNDKN